MLKYTLTIADLRIETADAITICFKKTGLRQIRYKPGQYITLIFRINGRRFIRPYSFSSTPGIDGNLEVTVKRVQGGIVSNHIFDKVRIGDLIEVMEPMGDFIINDSFLSDPDNQSIILWGVGSGITPLYSIIKFVLNNYKSKVTLVYGNKNHETAIFSKQLNDLQKTHTDRFHIHHFHTQPFIIEDNPYVIHGRIKPAKVLAIMHKNNNLDDTHHYICGPSGLKTSVKEALIGLNVPVNKIYSEDFELVKDEREFTDIHTQDVHIQYEKIRTKVEVIKGKSILEAGLDSLIELPYSCQTGSCSVCKGKLISGKIKEVGPTTRHPDLQPDEYLLCCSYPLTNNVEISVQ